MPKHRKPCFPYFYPRPPYGGRRALSDAISCYVTISIHALRTEGDGCTVIPSSPLIYFYPRPPYGGRRKAARSLMAAFRFLSTPSVRRATDTAVRMNGIFSHFYPRPPYGGRRRRQWALIHLEQHFYPRPPYGGRHATVNAGPAISAFLSTPSVRRATPTKHNIFKLFTISIHALRTEGDATCATP